MDFFPEVFIEGGEIKIIENCWQQMKEEAMPEW